MTFKTSLLPFCFTFVILINLNFLWNFYVTACAIMIGWLFSGTINWSRETWLVISMFFIIFAIINGCPPDEGVMVELGYAMALEKPIFLFRDDFRRCTDSEDYPLNLMIFAGLPQDDWERYYYTSIEELSSPTKGLAKWIAHLRKNVEDVIAS